MDKKEFRFNVIDAVIILLLCLGLFVLIYNILGNDIQELFAPKHEVSYVFEVDSSFASAYSEGDYLQYQKRVLGKAREIDIFKITTISASPVANKSYITLRADAYEVDGLLFVDGVRLPDESFSVIYSNELEFKLITTTVLD